MLIEKYNDRSSYDTLDAIESEDIEAKWLKLQERFPVKSKKVEDEALVKQFEEFYDQQWKDQEMYTPSDFINYFGINRHLARYYLMNMLYERKLFRVKYSNKTFYGKYDLKTIDRFKEFTWMGVEIKYQRPTDDMVRLYKESLGSAIINYNIN